MKNLCMAVLGLGEAGSAIAHDLVQVGATVRGYDPLDLAVEPGVLRCRSEADAVTGADLVLSVNSATAAVVALQNGAPALGPGAVWADLNTSAARLKVTLAAELAARTTASDFVDVALMAPVPGNGIRTPMLVSGVGGARYAEVMTALGADVEVLAEPPGAAATRKLLRSVFFKGMAGAVVESLAAARTAGLEDWLRSNIAAELVAAGPETVDRLEQGSIRHALRRSHEMAAATELLQELGVPPRIAAASRDLLTALTRSDP